MKVLKDGFELRKVTNYFILVYPENIEGTCEEIFVQDEKEAEKLALELIDTIKECYGLN